MRDSHLELRWTARLEGYINNDRNRETAIAIAIAISISTEISAERGFGSSGNKNVKTQTFLSMWVAVYRSSREHRRNFSALSRPFPARARGTRHPFPYRVSYGRTRRNSYRRRIDLSRSQERKATTGISEVNRLDRARARARA